MSPQLNTVGNSPAVRMIRSSQHEEADQCLLLHAALAALDGYTSVIVHSADTDVFILCLEFSDQNRDSLYQNVEIPEGANSYL